MTFILNKIKFIKLTKTLDNYGSIRIREDDFTNKIHKSHNFIFIILVMATRAVMKVTLQVYVSLTTMNIIGL